MQCSTISKQPQKDDSEFLTKFKANSHPQVLVSASVAVGASIQPMHASSISSGPLRHACIDSSVPVEVEAIVREVLSKDIQCTGTAFHTTLIFSFWFSLKENSVKLLM